MTADRGNDAADDFELLAEYAAGLLDATPEGAAITARLANEPELARLHEALTSADALIRAELRELRAPTMPADLAADLDAVLAAEPPLRATPALDRAAVVVPLRRHRWAARVGAVAAGFALLGGLGFAARALLPSTERSGSLDAAKSASSPARTSVPMRQSPDDGLAKSLADYRVASGTDYTTASLSAQVTELVSHSYMAAASRPAAAPSGPLAGAWSSQSLLNSCLEALGFVGRTLAVDYATFDGKPAIVVVAGDTAHLADVAVVGPDCGRTGTDERLRTTVPL